MFARKGREPSRRRPTRGATGKTPTVQYYRSPTTQSIDQTNRQSRRPEERRQSGVVQHLQRLPVYLSVFVIAGSLVYCSILGNNVSVVLSAPALYEKTHYESEVGHIFNSSVFNHSKLTLDVRSLKAEIVAKIPEASDVTVSIPFVGRKPVIGLSIVPAKYLMTLPNNKAYVIGSNGVALADAKKVNQSYLADLRTLQEDIPLDITVGETVLSPSDISFIETVLRELRSANLPVSRLQLPVGASELFVYLKDQPYFIKFALNGDARQQAGAFLAVKHELGAQTPAGYVDVRVGERVFVK